jgi:hypothetical protein
MKFHSFDFGSSQRLGLKEDGFRLQGVSIVKGGHLSEQFTLKAATAAEPGKQELGVEPERGPLWALPNVGCHDVIFRLFSSEYDLNMPAVLI